MSPLPSADRELAELQRFLAADAHAQQPRNEALRELRQKAQRLSLRLANPVRVALVGLPGSGKSALAGFMAGHSYENTPGGISRPVILRYGDKPISVAGWWSGAEVAQARVDFTAAEAEKPDYFELRLPNPVLNFLSFLDLPGQQGWDAQKKQMQWVSGRADVLIWCTPATDPWVGDEWQLWSLVPKRLQSRSILVVTNIDKVPPDSEDQRIDERLTAHVEGQFQEVVAAAPPVALAAAPLGRVQNAATWEASGGKAMVGALLTSARAVRRSDIAAAREILGSWHAVAGIAPPSAPAPEPAPLPPMPRTAPAPTAQPAPPEPPAPEPAMPEPAMPEPAPAVAPEIRDVPPAAPPPAPILLERPEPQSGPVPESGPAPEPAPAPAAQAPGPRAPEPPPSTAQPMPSAPPAVPILRMLDDKLSDLIAYVSDDGAFKDWEFMTKITETGDELSIMASGSGALSEEGRWVRTQIEEAFVTLSLLQMEQGDQPLKDAATVLLQLARDLTWAAAGREAA